MEKEAKYSRMTAEEFMGICQTMDEIPRKKIETQRDYFVRLSERYGVKRSRFTMQVIEGALAQAQGDTEKAFEIYREKMKETGKKKKPETAEEQREEQQVPGQIEMELVEAKPAEMSDQVKMMRFIAGQVDKLYMKLDKLNDTMSMILRAVRKE